MGMEEKAADRWPFLFSSYHLIRRKPFLTRCAISNYLHGREYAIVPNQMWHDETAFDAFYDDIAGSIGGLSNVI